MPFNDGKLDWTEEVVSRCDESKQMEMEQEECGVDIKIFEDPVCKLEIGVDSNDKDFVETRLVDQPEIRGEIENIEIKKEVEEVDVEDDNVKDISEKEAEESYTREIVKTECDQRIEEEPICNRATGLQKTNTGMSYVFNDVQQMEMFKKRLNLKKASMPTTILHVQKPNKDAAINKSNYFESKTTVKSVTHLSYKVYIKNPSSNNIKHLTKNNSILSHPNHSESDSKQFVTNCSLNDQIKEVSVQNLLKINNVHPKTHSFTNCEKEKYSTDTNQANKNVEGRVSFLKYNSENNLLPVKKSVLTSLELDNSSIQTEETSDTSSESSQSSSGDLNPGLVKNSDIVLDKEARLSKEGTHILAENTSKEDSKKEPCEPTEPIFCSEEDKNIPNQNSALTGQNYSVCPVKRTYFSGNKNVEKKMSNYTEKIPCFRTNISTSNEANITLVDSNETFILETVPNLSNESFNHESDSSISSEENLTEDNPISMEPIREILIDPLDPLLHQEEENPSYDINFSKNGEATNQNLIHFKLITNTQCGKKKVKTIKSLTESMPQKCEILSTNNFNSGITDLGNNLKDNASDTIAESQLNFNNQINNYSENRALSESYLLLSKNFQKSSIVKKNNQKKVMPHKNNSNKKENILNNTKYSFDSTLTCANVPTSSPDCKDRFVCYHCNYSTHRKDVLKSHIVINHIREKTEKCPLCPYRAPVKAYVFYHLRNSHNPNKPPRKKGHRIRQKKEGTAFHCNDCGYYTYKKMCLKTHILLRHLKEKNKKCPFCDYRSVLQEYITIHVRSVHLKHKPHSCQICDMKFSTHTLLKFHIESVHFKLKRFQCFACPRSFYQGRHLNNHLSNHVSSVEYNCPQISCDFVTSSKKELNEHLKIHYRRQCTFCSFSSKKSGTFYFHMLDNHKVYVCSYCDFNSHDKNEYSTHIKSNHQCQTELDIHQLPENQASFNCDVCSYKVNTMRKLKYHKKKEHNNVSLECIKCEFCDYESNCRSTTEDHMTKEHGATRVFMCPYCSCCSPSQKFDIVQHAMIAHGVNLNQGRVCGVWKVVS